MRLENLRIFCDKSKGASTHCLGHSQLPANYNYYQSRMIERC